MHGQRYLVVDNRSRSGVVEIRSGKLHVMNIITTLKTCSRAEKGTIIWTYDRIKRVGYKMENRVLLLCF